MAKERKKGQIAREQKTYKIKITKEGGLGAYAEGSSIALPKSTAEAVIKIGAAEKVGKW
tara:strand:+ start:2751 stop:2927 length:177 start_codon:yes stop_codon:yes gene_type:complete